MAFNDAADAIMGGDMDVLRKLLEADPSLASEEEVYDEVMESIDEPPSVEMAPVIGTLLTLAAKYGRREMAKLLLDSGAEANSLETVYWHGAAAESRTPVFMAVWAGDVDLVQLLVEYGADVQRASGPPGAASTPLEEAVCRGQTEVVRSLIDARADVAAGGAEDHLLCRAIQGQHKGVVELLLDSGVPVTQGAAGNESGKGPSPLVLAARRNCPEIARMLLERGAGAADEPLDDMSLLALTSSAQAQLEEFVQKGTPGLEQDWRAKMRKDHLELVQLLQDKGVLKASPGSLEHVTTVFQHFDANGDGVIQREELVQVLQLLDGERWTDQRIDDLVVAADANQDGKIQFGEFLKWVFSGEGAQEASPGAGK